MLKRLGLILVALAFVAVMTSLRIAPPSPGGPAHVAVAASPTPQPIGPIDPCPKPCGNSRN